VRTDELDYDLPPELIAQHPVEPRDESRLLVYDRASGAIRHRSFRALPEESGDALVVVNDTRVLPARLRLERPGGGDAEVLLLEPLGGGEWEGLARPTRRLRPGQRLGPVELLESLGEGRWRIRLEGEPDGRAPLPPYITEPLADRPHREGRVDLPLGAAQMRDEDRRRAALAQQLDRRQRRADARVVGDPPAVERHVEVDPHEHPLAGHVGIADAGLGEAHSVAPPALRGPCRPARRNGWSSPTRCRTRRPP